MASPSPIPTVPPFVQACNITNDVDQSSYASEIDFAYANNQCLQSFTRCLNNLGSTDCSASCTAEIDMLQNGCGADDTYCEIAGSNYPGTILPTFDFRTAACVPNSCDQSTHDAYQNYWRGVLCGPNYWSSADCQQISLTCAYPIKPVTIGWIVGGSVLACLACCCALFLWWRFCARKPLPTEEEVDLFESGNPGAAGGAFVLVDEATGMPVGVVGNAGRVPYYAPAPGGATVGVGYPNTAAIASAAAAPSDPRWTYAVRTGADGISLAPSGSVTATSGPAVAPTVGSAAAATVVVPTARGDRVESLLRGGNNGSSHAAILAEGEDKL